MRLGRGDCLLDMSAFPPDANGADQDSNANAKNLACGAAADNTASSAVARHPRSLHRHDSNADERHPIFCYFFPHLRELENCLRRY